MKHQITILLLLLVTSLSFAQIKYEEGYIIDNGGNRIDCFIKNLDWSNNPTEFLYKKGSNSSEILTGDINTIKEFGIGDYIKFQRFNIDVDMSSNAASKMSNTYEPEFERKQMYLKLLVEGDANLYSYQDNNIYRFFYSTNNQEVSQLIYKKYKLNNTQISINDSYKKQLYDNLKCSSLGLEDTRSLRYSKKNLVAFFDAYNNCTSNSSTIYEDVNSKGRFNARLKAGYFNSALKVDFDPRTLAQDAISIDYGGKGGVRVAAEIEYILPFNRNKWSVFLEPGYQSNSYSETVEVGGATLERFQEVSVDYEYVDVLLGLRHYMYINDKSRLFVNGAFTFVFDLTDQVELSDNTANIDIDVNSTANFNFGLGYEFNKRYSVEVRVATNRNIVRDFTIITSDYNSYGIVLGYQFL